MALEDSTRPQVRYARESIAAAQGEETLSQALRLARKLEELLEDTRSVVSPTPTGGEEARAHSLRMARAMAASLVDELDSLNRPPRSSSGVA
jgi:hypothetical protein